MDHEGLHVQNEKPEIEIGLFYLDRWGEVYGVSLRAKVTGLAECERIFLYVTAQLWLQLTMVSRMFWTLERIDWQVRITNGPCVTR